MLKRVYNHFMEDSLYRNSIYLMLNTAVMAGLGFVFWIVVARLYTPADVGLGSALISVIGLISGISLLGLNVALIRFLPNSKRQEDKINTVLTITGIAALFVSTIYLLGIGWWSPDLYFVKKNLFFALGFILGMVVMTLFNVIDNVFIGLRASSYVLLKGIIYSLGKLVLAPLLFAMGAFGIFGSWILSSVLGLLVAMILLIRHFKIRPTFLYSTDVLSHMGTYSAKNYLAGFITAAPMFLFPLIVLHRFGAETTAVFFISMQLAGVVFGLPAGVAAAWLAEGSASGRELHLYIITLKRSLLFAVLASAVVAMLIWLVATPLLSFFGKSYSSQGGYLLSILLLSAVFMAAGLVLQNHFKVRGNIHLLIWISSAWLVLLVVSALVLPTTVSEVGYVWLMGQIVFSSLLMLFVWRDLASAQRTQNKSS